MLLILVSTSSDCLYWQQRQIVCSRLLDVGVDLILKLSVLIPARPGQYLTYAGPCYQVDSMIAKPQCLSEGMASLLLSRVISRHAYHSVGAAAVGAVASSSRSVEHSGLAACGECHQFSHKTHTLHFRARDGYV